MTKTLEYLDPTTLVIGGNIRTDTQLGALFLASVKERGVLEPVDAHRDGSGQVVLVRGQRRTLAAVKAGLDSIPVLVDDQAPEDADRLVDQWTENEHRTALTPKERIQAVEQMALVGLSAGQIAKRASISKTEVAAAAIVAKSQTALDHADSLTLEDAALVAEFEDDPEAVASLLQEATWGHPIAVHAERLRGDRTEKAAIAAKAAELTAQGATVIDQPNYNDNTALVLDRLLDGKKKKIDPEKHATTCPGHVVWVTSVYHWQRAGDDATTLKVVPGCKGWAQHGHLDSYGSTVKKAAADMTEKELEKVRKERRHVIESNKDWKAATTVRRRWLAQFGQRKTAPDGAEALVALAIANGWRSEMSGYTSTSEAFTLLSTTQEVIAGELATATPKRALQIALALTIASWEASIEDDTWRKADSRLGRAQRVLAAISQWGHELSDIETRIVDGTAATPA